MITPAISVLSAVEGLEIITPALKPYVLPLTLAILTGLFFIQKRGTGTVGLFFGPVMAGWFGALGLLGVLRSSTIRRAGGPQSALRHPLHRHPPRPGLPGPRLGGAGGDRRRGLYTDMGHFGRFPIRLAWFAS
jgi:KUP system potassium uptake protein